MSKEQIISFLKNLRILKAASFMMMMFFGWFFYGHFSGIWNFLDLILGLIAIFCTWQFSITVNDIFDVEIDKVSHPDRPMVKGFIGRKKYILIAIIIIAVGLISGFIMSLYSMIFVGLYFIMGYIYSAPPLRLRNYIFGTVFIGLGSSLAYFTGVFSGGEMLNWTQIMIGILILIALSMGTVVKDYKDYEGDKKEGVTNIFTYFGLEKGMKITTVLLIITFLLPFILIYHLIDFIVIIPIALTVVILFNLDRIKRKTQVTMIFFFIEILYVFLRVIGIINFL